MILLLSTSDTDLLSARASGADYRLGNPNRTIVEEIPELLADIDLVIVRILGGYRMWESGIDALLASGKPVLVLGGEQQPDAELMKLSTVAYGVSAEAHAYLAQGGAANLRELSNFLSDTVLLTGFGFEPPAATPMWGVLDRTPTRTDGPTVAVLYYRAHHVAGNTACIEALCQAIEGKGGQALPVFCASLRAAEPELLETLARADALVVTVLAAGGTKPATASAGGDDEAWDVGQLAALDVPILQGLCLTSSRESWLANGDGLSPLDAATQVAIPEIDGRNYLFGYDATAGVVQDWMYEKLTEAYVLDPQMRKFFGESNPWALHGIAERLLEAAQRNLWEHPDPETMAALQQVYLETESDLEGCTA